MLHYINSGSFSVIVNQMLIEKASKNIKSQLFVHAVIQRWQQQIANGKNVNGEPMVSPSLALKMSRGYQEGEEEE